MSGMIKKKPKEYQPVIACGVCWSTVMMVAGAAVGSAGGVWAWVKYRVRRRRA